MAILVVDPGSCGYRAVIEVEQEEGVKNSYTLAVRTDCKFVERLGHDLSRLNMLDAFTAMLHNPVYIAASKRLKHPACPVPSGILKALEVAAGLNVPKSVTMIFIERGKDEIAV